MRRHEMRRGLTALTSVVVLLLTSACAGAARQDDPGGDGAKSAVVHLAWAPPKLEDAETITVGPEGGTIDLDPSRDYVIQLPSHPVVAPDGLSIVGGHDVVLTGGEIFVPPDPEEVSHRGRGLLLEKQTGTVAVQGLRITGPGLTEGIDLADPEAVVRLQDIHVDDVHYPSWLQTHPDVIQSWSGPRKLQIDGLTAATHYQGLFLSPEAFGPVKVSSVQLKRVQIDGLERSGYLLWGPPNLPVHMHDVWLRSLVGRPLKYSLHPLGGLWSPIRSGRPPSEFASKDETGTDLPQFGYGAGNGG